MKEKLSTKLMKVYFFVFTFGISSIFLYYMFKGFNWTFKSLLQIMLKETLSIVISLFFIVFVIYAVIRTTAKRKIICKLKNINDFRNIDDPYSFELLFEYKGRVLAYNIKEDTHPYIIDNNYIVVVRDDKILNILSSTNQEVNNKESYWSSTYMPDGSQAPYNLLIMYYLFATMFLIGIIVILINIFANHLAGKELNNNIISLIICLFIFIFFARGIYYDYRRKKEGE